MADVANVLEKHRDDPCVQSRWNTLMLAQTARRMTPRNDSLLTCQYILGNVQCDVRDVVDQLIAVEYIYSTTDYGTVVENVLRAMAYRLKEDYDITWTEVWKIVRTYGPMIVKLQCLVDAGLTVPDTF